MEGLNEEQLMEVYQWVDQIPLSRKKRNMPRDFSDGVLLSEVIAHFFPRLVDLHNYNQGLRVETKLYNWKTLSKKVLQKLGIKLDQSTLEALANAKPGVIEGVLYTLKGRIEEKKHEEEKPYFEDITSPSVEVVEQARAATDRNLLIEKIRECEEQEEYIAALEEKIMKLEELMRLKDAKIARLSTHSTRIVHQ